MKKLILPLAIFMTAALALSGCAPKSDPNALTILGKTSDLNKPYMTELFDHYRSVTGESLNILAIEDSKYEAEAYKMLQKGEMADIFLHFHNADLTRFRPEENFCTFNGAAWVDDLTTGAKAYCTDANGNLLGLPFWESSVSGCYYNKKLFESCGLNPVTTQEDFNGLCKNLAELGVTPILWPADGCSWMMQFGLDPVFADDPDLLKKLNAGETSYADIPAVTDMVTWLSDAAQKGWFGNNYLETGWDGISPALAEGRAAMTFIWDTWFDTDFKDGKYKKEDFALMPVFMNTAKAGTYEGGNLNMMMVYNKSEKKDRALAFLDFCATPENYNVAFNGISTVSVFKGQTTNIQSKMVTDAQQSIEKLERVSTASTKIVGYSADSVAEILNDLFRKKITVAECIARMDASRLTKTS